MGNERKATEGVRRQIRLIPDKHNLFDTLIDMQCFFIEITNKEPTRIIMGAKQWNALALELEGMRMILSPWRSPFLLGMSITVKGIDGLEVTC